MVCCFEMCLVEVAEKMSEVADGKQNVRSGGQSDAEQGADNALKVSPK